MRLNEIVFHLMLIHLVLTSSLLYLVLFNKWGVLQFVYREFICLLLTLTFHTQWRVYIEQRAE